MGQDNIQKLDIWAHDIYLSFEQGCLEDLIIENTYRYVRDIILPYSIIVTRRKTTKENGQPHSYYLLPIAKNYCELEKEEILETIRNWKNDESNNINELIEQNNNNEDWKEKLLKKYSCQEIKDNELLFKLYKDQMKDNQTAIITDRYSAGYFKSLQETTNDLFIMDINSAESYLRQDSENTRQSDTDLFTKLEELILIPRNKKRWTLCAVRLNWFDEFIGSIGIIFDNQPSHKSFRKIIDYLHAVKRNYSEEIMKLILKEAKDDGNNFMDAICQCIGSIRIVLSNKNEKIKAYKDPLKLYANNKDLFKIFKPYFDFDKDNFNKEFALPLVTISENKLLPILLKYGANNFLVFLEAKDKYDNNNKKYKNMAEQNIWKLGWLWRNYNDIK